MVVQRYKSHAIIPEEPYTLHITYKITTLVKYKYQKSLILTSTQTGRGTGVDITNLNDRTSAVIKTFDTAFIQHMKHFGLGGKTGEIESRIVEEQKYYITYYGYQRTFKRERRKNKYYVVTRRQGKIKAYTRYENVGVATIRTDIQTTRREKLDVYKDILTIGRSE